MREVNYLYNKKCPVSILEFDTISDIAKYVKEGKPSLWFEKKQTSHEISGNMTDFCKTRTFTNAYNMLTLTGIKYVDPEHPDTDYGRMYPLNKTVTAGINLSF